MNKITKVITANAVIAVITAILMMLILKVNINIGNFNFFFLISIITFILGNLILYEVIIFFGSWWKW